MTTNTLLWVLIGVLALEFLLNLFWRMRVEGSKGGLLPGLGPVGLLLATTAPSGKGISAKTDRAVDWTLKGASRGALIGGAIDLATGGATGGLGFFIGITGGALGGLVWGLWRRQSDPIPAGEEEAAGPDV